MALRLVISILLFMGGLLSSGCYNQQLLIQETFTFNSPYAVLDTPALAELQRQSPPPSPEQAWWYSRGDAALGVREHEAPVELIDYQIRTIDRQRVHGDRVYDNVNRTTYSTQYGRMVR